MAPTSSDLPTAKKARLEPATYMAKTPETMPVAAHKKRGRSVRPRSAPSPPGLNTPPTSTPPAHRRGRRLQPIEAAHPVLASTPDVASSHAPALESWDMAATASFLSSAFATASWQPTTPPTDTAHDLSLLHGLRSSFALSRSGAPMRAGSVRTSWSAGPCDAMQHLATSNHAWRTDFGANSTHDAPRHLHGDDEAKRREPLRGGSTLATATLHLAALEAILADDADDEYGMFDRESLPTEAAWPYYV
ncbi:hypothetical protein SPRG_14314 [Saprolegnia parasitica CBS 223.65]|uniref:Uncharacterized protein n=1 Tax=Saprolegnia parasitica (strain CBS 223.65) TaxID=695850 RepID=A0A067C0U0_SAPPC|nr:hypothetical protein SPRG_14314 [Saprolegnia parasitica CBS 223.65]KDO20442.1 hypothetical protein SPRG_14314 [Saprolegnia parasitica CBS 223.65]|eukprot:XP_012208832.1 hypothetical protein SPRG_14314 [Saprolegnia parasitica CBS 223.65]